MSERRSETKQPCSETANEGLPTLTFIFKSQPGGQGVNPPALIHPKSLQSILWLLYTLSSSGWAHPWCRLHSHSCWRVLAWSGLDDNLIPRIWKGFRTWKQRWDKILYGGQKTNSIRASAEEAGNCECLFLNSIRIPEMGERKKVQSIKRQVSLQKSKWLNQEGKIPFVF